MVDVITPVLAFVAILVALFFLSGIRVLKGMGTHASFTFRTIHGLEGTWTRLSCSLD